MFGHCIDAVGSSGTTLVLSAYLRYYLSTVVRCSNWKYYAGTEELSEVLREYWGTMLEMWYYVSTGLLSEVLC